MKNNRQGKKFFFFSNCKMSDKWVVCDENGKSQTVPVLIFTKCKEEKATLRITVEEIK